MASGDFGYSWDDPNAMKGGGIGSLPGSQTGQGGAGLGSGGAMQMVRTNDPGAAPQPPTLHAMDMGPQQMVQTNDPAMPGNSAMPSPQAMGMITSNDPGGGYAADQGQPAGVGQSGTPPPPPQLDGMKNTALQLQQTNDPAQAGVLHDQLSRQITQTLQAQGHDVKVGENGQITVDGRPYTVGGGAPTATGAPTGGTSGDRHNTADQESFIAGLNTHGALDAGSGFDSNFQPGESNDQYQARLNSWVTQHGGASGAPGTGLDWMPSGTSGYTPGNVNFDDIPNFSYDSLMGQMSTPEVDNAIKGILANPESLGERQTSMMKAASKDELADQEKMQEEDLGSMAGSYGIDESPWLASQKMALRQGRDNALIGSNRAVDMQAAQTNMADRRAAAGLGLDYQSAKQSKVMSAASASLDRASAVGGRMALREATNQQAAQLGISAQALLSQHIMGRLQDLTQRYGIDVGKEISLKQLAQADRFHLEDITMKMQQFQAQLAQNQSQFDKSQSQQDNQFKASHDLNTDQFNLDADKWDWAKSHPSEVGN